AVAALMAGGFVLAAPLPAEAQWDALLNSGMRVLQQQQELEFRREQEERRRQEEERRRQDELQRREQYRQSPPVRWEPPPRQPERYATGLGSGPDPSQVAEIQRLLNERGYD